jgi:hypothetical protein
MMAQKHTRVEEIYEYGYPFLVLQLAPKEDVHTSTLAWTLTELVGRPVSLQKLLEAVAPVVRDVRIGTSFDAHYWWRSKGYYAWPLKTLLRYLEGKKFIAVPQSRHIELAVYRGLGVAIPIIRRGPGGRIEIEYHPTIALIEEPRKPRALVCFEKLGLQVRAYTADPELERILRRHGYTRGERDYVWERVYGSTLELIGDLAKIKLEAEKLGKMVFLFDNLEKLVNPVFFKLAEKERARVSA